MLLTVLTVAATWVDLGAWNIWLALLIAVVKGSLVALYFMHLRWDSPFNAIVLMAALFFVALFVGSVVLDAREYQVNYNPPARAGSTP
jgi:cytochrome c oxidase subunit 4